MEKVFDFNEFGICMNPNVQSFVSGKYRAMIETAPIDGRWYYGCMLDTPTSGFGSGVCKQGPDFATESEALAAVAKKSIEWFDEDTEWHKKAGKKRIVPQFIYDELKKLLHPQPVQLCLFDF